MSEALEPVEKPEEVEETEPIEGEIVDAEDETEEPSNLPNRDSKDRLPIRPTWQVIAYGIFYILVGLLLGALTFYMFTGEEGMTWISWFFAVFIILGTLAAFYSAYDELRHFNEARQLDQFGIDAQARIIDRWNDHYVDGGILTRKTIYHILYLFNEDQTYGKHSISKSLYQQLSKGGRVAVTYLKDTPEIYRLTIAF